MLSHPRGTNTNRTRQNPQAGNRGWVSEPRPYLSLSVPLRSARACAPRQADRTGEPRTRVRARARVGEVEGGRAGRIAGDAGRRVFIARRGGGERWVWLAGSREPPRRERRRAAVAVRRGRFFTGLDLVRSGRAGFNLPSRARPQFRVSFRERFVSAARVSGLAGFTLPHGPRQRAAWRQPVPSRSLPLHGGGVWRGPHSSFRFDTPLPLIM